MLTAFQKAEAYKRRKAGEPLSLIAQAYRVQDGKSLVYSPPSAPLRRVKPLLA